MSDLRIEYLKLTDNRPSANSAVVASIFMYVTMVGLALEKDNTKSIPLRLWLVGVIIQTVVRSTLKVFQGRMRGMGNGVTHEEIATINRTVDNIELASYVWFALGNILFLESQDCKSESPFVYFLCVIYFSVSYAALFTFHIVQISLIVWPPTSTEDRLYWMQNRFVYPENDVDELVPTLREYPIYTYTYTNTSVKQSATGLTQQQTLFWTDWLASHGCITGPYAAESTPKSEQGNQVRTKLILQLDFRETDETDTSNVAPIPDAEISKADSELCSICLLELITPVQTPHTPRTPRTPQTAHISHAAHTSQAHFGHGSTPPSAPSLGSMLNTSVFYCKTCSTISNPCENNTSPPVQKQKHNNTVRYPCPGRHYFHVDCLHGWMQSATERKWDISGRERLVFARCPYCRQAPCS